jgi:pimeloyl-ACP methyl ester carboxylesterase
MNNKAGAQSELRHRQVDVEGLSIHAVEGGSSENPVVLFLHGWPEDVSAFAHVMLPLSKDAHVVAIDLPGIGGSVTPPPANDKRTLARIVRSVIHTLDLTNVTLVGHDVGGQIVYAYLHAYPAELKRAVMLNIVIPGIDPWNEVIRNPFIWHFAFHAIPNLPETLVAGHEAEYFAFFYAAISARPDAVSKEARAAYLQAYSRPEALHTGFEWYRAFPQDERDNLADKGSPIATPLLYLRGEVEGGSLEAYVKGLREAGMGNVQGSVIPKSGHYALDEQSEGVEAILREFMQLPV